MTVRYKPSNESPRHCENPDCDRVLNRDQKKFCRNLCKRYPKQITSP